MNYYQLVEDAWQLSESALRYVKDAQREVGIAELWAEIFSQSPLVDLERTRQEGGSPPTRVFLKSPYGIQYRAEQKDWLPFRHGPVDFFQDPSLT